MDRNTALRMRLRKIIREHTQQERRTLTGNYVPSRGGRMSLRRLFEQDEATAPASGAGTIATPWITPEDDKKLREEGPNRAEKNGNPGNDINMLQGASPDALTKTALELLKYGRSITSPNVAIDNYGFGAWKGEADGAKWLESIGGPEELKSRIAKIAGGAAGLVPRADMPVFDAKKNIDVKNPETGETVASGLQDQVAADLLAKGAVDVVAPFAGDKSTPPAETAASDNKVKEALRRGLRDPYVTAFVVNEYCARNGYLLFEEGDPFPTNLSAADKDNYLTKGMRDGSADDDVGKIPSNKGAQTAVSNLEPSQSDVYLSKALGFAFGRKYEGDPVIFAGNKVLDGHHRWAGASLAEPGFQMKGIQIGDPSPDGVATALKALRSIGNAMGNAQKGGKDESKKESRYRSGAVMVERWQKLAGIIKG